MVPFGNQDMFCSQYPFVRCNVRLVVSVSNKDYGNSCQTAATISISVLVILVSVSSQ